jgi:hypothetical protein
MKSSSRDSISITIILMKGSGRGVYSFVKWSVLGSSCDPTIADRRPKVVEPNVEVATAPAEAPDPEPQAPDSASKSASEPTQEGKRKKKKHLSKPKTKITLLHCDIIQDEFWDARPSILAS